MRTKIVILGKKELKKMGKRGRRPLVERCVNQMNELIRGCSKMGGWENEFLVFDVNEKEVEAMFTKSWRDFEYLVLAVPVSCGDDYSKFVGMFVSSCFNPICHHLSDFIVKEECRGYGIGRKMLKEFMKFLKNKVKGDKKMSGRGVHVELEVLEGSKEAKKLYEDFGFKHVRHVMKMGL